MTVAKSKVEDKGETKLTQQERLDLFVMGVKRLSEQYQISIEPTIKADFKFGDLAPKEEKKEETNESEATK